MKASVILFCKNQKETISKIIPALLAQDYDKNEYEVVAVDSGSTDGSVEYLKSYPQITLLQIKPEEFQYSRTFNLGASHSSGEILVKLSGDAVPINDQWLSELLKPFADSDVGATYGKYIIDGTRPGYGYPQYWPARRFPDRMVRHKIRMNVLSHLNVFQDFKAMNITGGCCAFRRSIWEMRPLNEQIPKGEDAEWAWFIHLVGYDIVYTPYAIVEHEHKNIPFYILRDWRQHVSMNNAILEYWFHALALGKDRYKEHKIAAKAHRQLTH